MDLDRENTTSINSSGVPHPRCVASFHPAYRKLGRTTNTLLTRGEMGGLREAYHLVVKVGSTGSIKVSVKEAVLLGTIANVALFGATNIETAIKSGKDIADTSCEETFATWSGNFEDAVNVALPPVDDKLLHTMG